MAADEGLLDKADARRPAVSGAYLVAAIFCLWCGGALVVYTRWGRAPAPFALADEAGSG